MIDKCASQTINRQTGNFAILLLTITANILIKPIVKQLLIEELTQIYILLRSCISINSTT